MTAEAGLVPKKAAALLSAYEAKAGVRLPTPPTVEPDKKAAAIADSAVLLFARHTEVVAANKWTRLFERRLSEAGLDREIGAFQDQLGSIETQAAAITRGIHRLAGHPPEALDNLDEAEAPKTQADRQLFLQGEIGALREDRSNLRRQAIFDILIRLAVDPDLQLCGFRHSVSRDVHDRLLGLDHGVGFDTYPGFLRRQTLRLNPGAPD